MRDEIQRLIAAYAESDALDRELASRYDVLPTSVTLGGGWGITADRVAMVWEDDTTPRIERDPRKQRLALAAAARKYPTLASLRPARPLDGIDCPHCHGSGSLDHLPQSATSLCGTCFAVGWILRDDL